MFGILISMTLYLHFSNYLNKTTKAMFAVFNRNNNHNPRVIHLAEIVM